jgi:hypothetical protein
METLFNPAVIDQATSQHMIIHATHTSDYPNYKRQVINQRKDAAIRTSTAMATGTT